MGICMSSQLDSLPAAGEDDIKRMREKGYIPVIATPTKDFKGENELTALFMAEYENGAELTLVFKDEDRPSKVEDAAYDVIRRGVFGRWSDIETVFIIKDKMDFPGTYGGDQTWKCKLPNHYEESVALDKFQTDEESNSPILWVTVWNHLFAEKNTNPDMEISYQRGVNVTEKSPDTKDKLTFVIRQGTREEVDASFKGCISSVSKIMTPERQEALGKRIF